MTRSGIFPFLSYTLSCILIFCPLIAPHEAQASECGPGKRPLFFFADSSVSRFTPKGFNKRLYRQLKQPLKEIGYCITPLTRASLSDTAVQEELVMVLSMLISITERQKLIPGAGDSSGIVDSETVSLYDTSALMVVSLLRVDDWSSRQLKLAKKNPLLTLDYTPEEMSTFESVLMRKIVENLRTQYICHLRIQSVPEGATIRSKSGLEGITPLEWITPVGYLWITGEHEGFEPIRRRIDLSSPGMHTYVIEMGRRRFYHSRFFIPTLLLGASSAACFVVERVYYKKYQELDRDDRGKKPDPFEHNFTIAKNCERAAGVTLALAGVSLTLSFFF
ncbi:MAG: PEGA domain-containing protein [Chitinispirillaceae bacterium]|nr:PEGA domain-containing protein [Chitinispirillaceae bacterium]